MNNHEKIKAAIEKLLEAEQATAKARNWLKEAEGALKSAMSAEEKAQQEVSRQIGNVCPNKEVVFGSRIYKRQVCGALLIEGWDGLVL
jgi:hypothetical protein